MTKCTKVHSISRGADEIKSMPNIKRLSYRERVSCYSCLVLYLHGESNDSISGILLESIDKEIPINFSLLITPVKDTPSVNKTSAISKLGN